MAEPVYRPVIMLAKTVQMSMGWDVIVRGSQNLPSSGPVVLAINHAGYIDFVFSAWACVFEKKRWVRFLAKKEVFEHKLAGPLMRGMKHIPVDRKKDPARALDLAIEALERGEIIGTFPEATINRSFVPTRGKTGTVRMAQVSGATIVPLAVWGAHRILTKGRPRNIQRGVAILVNIGAPFELAADEDPRAATDRLMDAIRALLADAQAQYPQKPAGDSDRWWLPAHLGGTAPTPEEVAPKPDAASTPSAESASEVEEPAAQASDVAAEVEEPAPQASDVAPEVEEPAPQASDVAPEVEEPAPMPAEISPELPGAANKEAEAAPDAHEPAPRPAEPAREIQEAAQASEGTSGI
ncbi:MAG: 1-acyl-sn-glycerol-3-phosphate acyltransferase [Actinomycetota bacterium]